MGRVDRSLIAVVKALADPDRIRIAAALLERPRSASELASDLALPRPAIGRHLDQLAAAGLAQPTDERGTVERWTVERSAFDAIGRRLGELERAGSNRDTAADDLPVVSADDGRVLRAFVVDGRLNGIPAQEKKRAVILRWLVDRCFVEDRDYPEKEVNQRLALVHRDVASLRRYLVDGGLMTRSRGTYRRTTPS